MTKYIKFLIALLIIIISLFTVVIIRNSTSYYKLEIIQLETGWGYKILKDNKPFIRQEYIPAIEGNLRFPDKNSAKKTGLLVCNKLKNHEFPFVTKKELISLEIISNDTARKVQF
jgi:hypothetical protein